MVNQEKQEKGVGPRHMTGEQLAELGVQILNKFDLELECKTCGARWTPQLTPESELPPGYWKCPNRCNW